MPKVLIACTYPVNRGDELLLRSLESIFSPNTKFVRTVLNQSAAVGVEAISQPLGIWMKIEILAGGHVVAGLLRRLFPAYLWFASAASSSSKIVRLVYRSFEPRAWRRIRKAAESSEVCVAMPGGYMLAENADEWSWLSHLLTIRIVRATKTRVVGAPCSVGPFDSRWETQARGVPSLYDHLFLRDDTSVDTVNRLFLAGKLPVHVSRVTDLGFRHPWRSLVPTPSNESGKLLVGVSLRHYRFGGGENESMLRSNFETAVVNALDRLAAEMEIDYIFFAHDHAGLYKDAEYSEYIVARMASNAEVLSDRLHIEELVRRYGALDLLIGVRMHACIMALSMGTPVVPIAYEPKTYGAMGDFDPSMNVLDIRTMDADALYAAARMALQRDREAIRIRAQQIAEGLEVALTHQLVDGQQNWGPVDRWDI